MGMANALLRWLQSASQSNADHRVKAVRPEQRFCLILMQAAIGIEDDNGLAVDGQGGRSGDDVSLGLASR